MLIMTVRCWLLALALPLIPLTLSAQRRPIHGDRNHPRLRPERPDRSALKQAIQRWGNCRNVTLTLHRGLVALSDRNKFVTAGAPVSLAETLQALQDQGMYIDDVQLTERGRWLILYDNNGFIYDNLPHDLEEELLNFTNIGEEVTSVTFNDRGDWVVVSAERAKASSFQLQQELLTGIASYGDLLSAQLTDEGLVLCFEDGVRYVGKVPKRLQEALSRSHMQIYRVKFSADGAYFYADRQGRYSYNM